ncbi:MAG: hypothetical protein GY839_08185 [candidate division Zixibacteria bacterium]|nr:hypothetical protein [candidate division Zixibacteria bacterium]
MVRISGEYNAAFKNIGDKALRLIELKRKGYNVPDGIILSVDFFDEIVDSKKLEIIEMLLLDSINKADINIEKKIIDYLKESTSEEIDTKNELNNHILAIEDYSSNIRYAVRSAAIGEDSKNTSFAGQYKTILNVCPKDIWNAVFECYSSWWNYQAIAYRKQNNLRYSSPKMSIIIQKLVFPEFAGVIFTKHPVFNDKRIIIEAIQGIGEKLVSAQETPARWEIDPNNRNLIQFTENPTNSISENNFFYLDNIVRTVIKLKKDFGNELDIEWAAKDNQLYILQVRPITTSHLDNSINEITENVYARSIVEDLWSDRMSNITSSIIFEEFSDLYTYKNTLRKLRLHNIADGKSIQVINGYGYLSAHTIAKLLNLIPKFLRVREIENVFPPFIKNRVLQQEFKLLNIIKILPYTPLLLNDLAIIPIFTRNLLKRHLDRIESELNNVDLELYKSNEFSFYREELERILILLSKLQIRNQWGYGNATIFTWFFHHLAVKIFGKKQEWVLNHINNLPENVTSDLQVRLLKICEASDETIKENILNVSKRADLLRKLDTTFRNHDFTVLFRKFLKDFKYRSPNRDFIHPRWDEKPELVLDLLEIMIKNVNSEQSIAQRLPNKDGFFSLKNLLSIVPLAIVKRMAKSFLALREDLRFGLDKVFYRIRKLLLSINNHNHFNEIKEIKDGIFFLELNELRSILLYERKPTEFVSLIEQRIKSWKTEQNQSPPFYVKIVNDNVIDLTSPSANNKRIAGISASPGIIEGTARVIFNESEFTELREGEILVAHNTDPGWTPLFRTAAGVVVEMGGILNHCAIIAREYGIPAVVGVTGITRNIKNGWKLRVNGYTGIIEILNNGK